MEGVQDNTGKIWREVRFWIKVLADNLRATRKLSMQDVKILEAFQIVRPIIGVKEIKTVYWSKPIPGWVKLNCDGSCRGNPGNLGGGGIIRDFQGVVKAAFSAHFGHGTNNEAELQAILEGIRLCKQFHFFNVVIESDSRIVVDWFRKRRCTLWYLWDFWDDLMNELEGLNFEVVHQYRKGNGAADFLARDGETGKNEVYEGHNCLPRRLKGITRMKKLGIPYLRKGRGFF